jgi:hypothetical protein
VRSAESDDQGCHKYYPGILAYFEDFAASLVGMDYDVAALQGFPLCERVGLAALFSAALTMTS